LTVQYHGGLVSDYWTQRLLPGTGKVIYQDGFESTLVRCLKAGSGGGDATRDTALAYMGDASLKISTGAAIGATQYAEFPLPCSPTKKFGLDCVFAFPTVNGYAAIFQLIYIDQNKNSFQAAVRYELSSYDNTNFIINGKLQYQNSNNVYIDISNYKLFWYSLPLLKFARLKLIADFASEKYVSLVINDTLFDLSKYSVYKSASEHGPGLFAFFYCYNNPVAGGVADLNIDNLMVTDEET